MGEFRLGRQDLRWGVTKSSGGRRGGPRASRADLITGATITIEHQPSGLRVEGGVPEGRYTKAQLRERQEELAARLLSALAAAVEKHERGRSRRS